MAVTPGELRELTNGVGFPHADLPEGKGLEVLPSALSNGHGFLIVLAEDGHLVQFRTVGYVSCPADHPRLTPVLALLDELDDETPVRHQWDGREIVVWMEVRVVDREFTEGRFRSALSSFLQAIGEQNHQRIRQAMEADVDPAGGDDIGSWLVALARARGSARRYVATPYTPDLVDCAVFSQREIRPGNAVLVQVFSYLPDYADDARQLAQEYDEEAERLGSASLATEIMRGSVLTFELVTRELHIPDPVQKLVWRGRTQSVQFDVPIPEDCGSGNLISKVLISQDTIPIGQISFKLKVVSSEAAADTRQLPTGAARRYQVAFISYASEDRSEVLRRVQMLPAVGIRYFQDLLDLAPGERWVRELYRHIDGSDVLFLFWSTAAKESEWVKREWQYGLETKGEDFIHPIIIEGPPSPEPPPELAHLHFADPMLYFIRGSC